MKKVALSILMAAVLAMPATQAIAYNYGDHKSSTLSTKAWQSLEQSDVEGVLAYTNKNAELYEAKALTMQASLSDYPTDKDKVFSYWALNDVGTSYFIQAEAYRKAGMKEEAKKAYQKVVDEFSYAQAWDNGGFFWKPAEAAAEKLAMMESGLELDFGDMTSAYLVSKAWGALAANDLKAVEAYVNKTLSIYSKKALEMQASLEDYVEGANEKVFEQWALNDVSTALFILGKAYKNDGRDKDAIQAFETLAGKYEFGQTWDPQGWFWKPAIEAEKELILLENSL